MTLSGKRILLVIGGGIAAYKSLDLIRRLRERGAAVRCVMTSAAQEFVTQLSVGALSADHVFTDLFDRQDEHDVGHIRLSRQADLIVVAPATADLMAKLANRFSCIFNKFLVFNMMTCIYLIVITHNITSPYLYGFLWPVRF